MHYQKQLHPLFPAAKREGRVLNHVHVILVGRQHVEIQESSQE